MRERGEADVGLHIENFLAAGDEDRRGGEEKRADRDGGREGGREGREGRSRGKIRVSETANTNHNQMGKWGGGATVERNRLGRRRGKLSQKRRKTGGVGEEE